MTAAAEAVLTPSVTGASWFTRTIAAVRALAPYAAIELLLPGGSLIALVLWLYRRRYGTCTVESTPATRGKSTLT